MKKEKSRVVKFKKPIKNLSNIFGMGLIIVIVLYFSISMIIYMTREKISFYEVVYGKNASTANKSYNALIIRDEKVMNTDKSGYINFFAHEGSRVSLISTVYSLDQSDTIKNMIDNSNDEVGISNNDIMSLRKSIVSFSGSFDEKHFSSVYNFKNDLNAEVSEYINMNNLDRVNTLIQDNNDSTISIHKAEESGLVAYYTDDYENFSINNVSSKDFDVKNYKKNIVKSNELIENGSPAYKIVNSETWYLLIQISESEYSKYSSMENIKIKFIDRNIYTNGKISVFRGSDNNFYAKIVLDQYMGEYISSRFTDIKICESEVSGLKIPKSAVVNKDFYIIPVSYLGKGGNSNTPGFFKQVSIEGNVSIEFVSPTIYMQTEDFCYVSMEDFEKNDIIVMNDASTMYSITQTGSLEGVYNVNSGYCIFQMIDILGETSDYYIVSEKSSYGLTVYDHIVLNGNMVKENQIVFMAE